MTDGRSEPKAPLRPIAPPFGGLRSSRPLTRPAASPPSAPAYVPPAPRSPTPAAIAPVEAPPSAESVGAAEPVEAESAPEAHSATSIPGIDDFLSFVGNDEVAEATEPDDNARYSEAELAKSTQGDALFPRSIPAVPETVAAEPELSVEAPAEEPQHEPEAHEAWSEPAQADGGSRIDVALGSDYDTDVDQAETRVEGTAHGDASFAREEEAPAVDVESAGTVDVAVTGRWPSGSWPIEEPLPPAVSAHPTPHDIAAVRVDDDDPFGWETPIAYHDQDVGATRLTAATPDSDPFAVLRDVPPYSTAPAGDESTERPAAASAESVDAADDDEIAADDVVPGPSSVYAPDDAGAWQASATGTSAGPASEAAGGRAAEMLEELAAQVRTGRLRIDADEHTSQASVLASLLATILAPSREG